jgi:hypothetical protein
MKCNTTINDNLSLYHFQAIPSTLQNLKDTTILVNETLNLSCTFTAKPGSTITWIYNISQEPDLTIISIESADISDGPYTITSSTMSWKTSDIYQKKTISGYYFCKAENTAGEMITRTITLDIQRKYL